MFKYVIWLQGLCMSMMYYLYVTVALVLIIHSTVYVQIGIQTCNRVALIR